MWDMNTIEAIAYHARTNGIGHPTCSLAMWMTERGTVTYQPLRAYFNRGHYEPYKPFPANNNDYVRLA